MSKIDTFGLIPFEAWGVNFQLRVLECDVFVEDTDISMLDEEKETKIILFENPTQEMVKHL